MVFDWPILIVLWVSLWACRRRLTRDGTAEPISRDQILRRERGQGNINFPSSADDVQDWQPYPVDPYSCYICVTMHTYKGNGQKRELPVLFWPKTGVPESNSCRECCWPYLIGQHPLSPVFGQKRQGVPDYSYFARLPPIFGHFMFLPGGLLDYSSFYTVNPMLLPSGTRLNAMKRFCLCSPRSHLSVLTFFLLGGMLRRSRYVQIFFKQLIAKFRPAR